mgnify:CR=1 FL=1
MIVHVGVCIYLLPSIHASRFVLSTHVLVSQFAPSIFTKAFPSVLGTSSGILFDEFVAITAITQIETIEIRAPLR